jgi:hypothetical protein
MSKRENTIYRRQKLDNGVILTQSCLRFVYPTSLPNNLIRPYQYV